MDVAEIEASFAFNHKGVVSSKEPAEAPLEHQIALLESVLRMSVEQRVSGAFAVKHWDVCVVP